MRSQVWNWNVESPSVEFQVSRYNVLYVHNCHSLDSQCSSDMIQTLSNHCCHTYLSLHCVVDSTQCFDVYIQ